MVDGWSVITDVLWQTRTHCVSDDSEMGEVFIRSWWMDDQWLQTQMCSGKPEHIEWVSEPRPGLRSTSSSSFFLKKKRSEMIVFGTATLVLNFNKLAWAHAHLKKNFNFNLTQKLPVTVNLKIVTASAQTSASASAVRLQWFTIFALQVWSPTLLWLSRANSCWHAVDPLFSRLGCSSSPFTSTFSHPLC